MRKFLRILGLSLWLVQSTLLAADRPAYWARMDAEAHGNLGQMLDTVERSPALRQLRLRLPMEKLASALEAAGRFEALGLSPAEGRVLLEAFYRKNGLDISGPAPAFAGDLSDDLVPHYRAGREFDPLNAVLMRWPWDWGAVLNDEYAVMVDEIIASGAIPKIWVDSRLRKILAAFYLLRQGVDLRRIEWIIEDTDSVWMRDYGPQHIYDPYSTNWGVVDFHYYRNRPDDDDTPLEVADMNGVFTVDRQYLRALFTEGGNLNTDGEGTVFYSARTYDNNWWLPRVVVDRRITSALSSPNNIVLQGPTLDATGHVDMFMKIVNPDTVLVAQYDPDETDYQILEDDAALVAASSSGQGKPWNVKRIRQPDVYYVDFVYPVVRTYTNSLIVNDRVIVPTYGIPDDADALAVYAEVFPDKTIVPLNANDIIEHGGAWHCVTLEFPEPGTAHQQAVSTGARPILR